MTTFRQALRLGCIADDLTGATDLANELVRQGLRTIQVVGADADIGVPEADAVVVALKTRSVEPDVAVEQAVAALRRLRSAGCERFYFKYCSTFDSTPRGNIGPVLAALACELGVSGVVACPAFPATGRTVYQGHLFVGDRLLSETGMRHHPLNPMEDPDLVRVLQAQMTGRVGLLTLQEIEAGRTAERIAELIEDGVCAVVADAASPDHLAALGRYCATTPLSSGASGLGAGIARALAGADSASGAIQLPRPARAGRAILAGSCSEATRRQVAHARQICPHYRITLAVGADPEALLADLRSWIDENLGDVPLLIYSTAAPEEVAAQREAWPDGASEQLEAIFGEVAAYLAPRVGAILVAGGETSGAVVGRLGYETFQIGPEIDPGVPWTVAHKPGAPSLLMALKSGNFGSDDFLLKAWTLLP